MALADLSVGRRTRNSGERTSIDDLIQDCGPEGGERAPAEARDPELELDLIGMTAGPGFVKKTLETLFYGFLTKRRAREETTFPLRLELLGACADALASRYENLLNEGLNERQILKNPELLLRSTYEVRESIETLSEFGLSRKRILSQAGLLAVPPENLQKRRDQMEKIGIRGDGHSYAKILTMPQAEFMARYKCLRQAGMSVKAISSSHQLFHMRAETLRRKSIALNEMGFDPGAPLYGRVLGRKLETIAGNYRNLLENVGLDRKKIMTNYNLILANRERVNERRDYLEGYFGSEAGAKKQMLANHELLLTPVSTMEANAAFWSSLTPDAEIKPYMLLGSVEKKKRNAAWIRKRLFYRGDSEPDPKKDAAMQAFLTDRPRMLINSLGSARKIERSLRKRADKYVDSVQEGYRDSECASGRGAEDSEYRPAAAAV